MNWWYSSAKSWPSHYMGARGQLYAPTAFPPGKMSRYSLDKRPGGPQSRSGHSKEEKKSLPLTGIKARLSKPQPVHYADWVRYPGMICNAKHMNYTICYAWVCLIEGRVLSSVPNRQMKNSDPTSSAIMKHFLLETYQPIKWQHKTKWLCNVYTTCNKIVSKRCRTQNIRLQQWFL
jgi:hypothetical protein